MASIREIFVGVEGGGSSTAVVLTDDAGHILCARDAAETSNVLLIGEEGCARLIAQNVAKCIETDLKGEQVVIAGIALAMSGLPGTLESETTGLSLRLGQVVEQEFRAHFQGENNTSISENFQIYACNDAVSTGYAGLSIAPSGVPVFVSAAGSGSITIFMGTAETAGQPGVRQTYGGLGHMLSDEGSAYWLAHHVCKRLVSHDNRHKPFALREAILNYFKITTADELIGVFQQHFDKGYIAGLSRVIYDQTQTGELEAAALAEKYISRLGTHIGKALSVLFARCLGEVDREVIVLCVGNVWRSYALFRKTLVAAVQAHYTRPVRIHFFMTNKGLANYGLVVNKLLRSRIDPSRVETLDVLEVN